MKHSTDRILTTHVGSLPRPPDLLAMILAKDQGAPFDAERYASWVKSAVAEVVKKQAEAGIDVVADGEMGRFGFIPYVNDRLAGIQARPNPGGEGTWARSREHLAFPEYYAWAAQMPGAAGGVQRTQWVCSGPIAYKGHEALARDIDNLKAALATVNCEEAFMPAVSPAQLAGWNKNEFYQTDEEFRVAVADALHHEYQAIVDAGLVLQIDDPQLASHYTTHPELDIAQCRNWDECYRRALEPRARQHPGRAGALSHLLRHQYGSAGARPGAEAHRRHYAPRQRRRLFLRDRQPAARARVAGVGGV